MKLGAFSISLTVKDLTASKAFYEKLGFETSGKLEDNWLIMKNDNIIIGPFHGMFDKNMLTFDPGRDQDANTLSDYEDIRDLQKKLLAEGLKLLTQAEDGTGPAQTIGIAITESNANDYDADVNQALRAGATATSLTLFWDAAMQGSTYAPDFDWPTIANSYYPSKNMGLLLSLAVIDTVADRRPEALRALPFDAPRVISAFTAYAAEVLSRLEDTDLVAISIGNEVDGVLTSAQDRAAFANFFKAAKTAGQALRPGTPIGFTTQWHGFQGPQRASALAANATADAIFINYYPLDSGFRALPPEDISTRLDGMIAMAAGSPCSLPETGYPSGGCGPLKPCKHNISKSYSARLKPEN